jgi:hypothetical protein
MSKCCIDCGIEIKLLAIRCAHCRNIYNLNQSHKKGQKKTREAHREHFWTVTKRMIEGYNGHINQKI